MRILVCGSRSWTDRGAIFEELAKLSRNDIVIHGAAQGADSIAGQIAEQLGLDVIACPANWQRFGRAAGPVRNKEMLKRYQPDLVLAFTDNICSSKGTRHMINTAVRAGVVVRVIGAANVHSAGSQLSAAHDGTSHESTVKSIISFTQVHLPYGWLSNMSPHPIVYRGEEYATAEALFQCLRFNDNDIQAEIWEQRSPMAAKMIAKKHRAAMVVERMSDQDVENMGLVLMLKIEQHDKIRRWLLETGDAIIIEDCTTRNMQESGLFWGATRLADQWAGQNNLGKLWAELREEIQRGDW